MFRKNTKDEDINFWLSYADLMAGLLFVFILLIGAIVVKSIVLKSNLESKENSLESSLQLLLLRDTEVQRLQALLSQKTDELSDKEKEFQNTLELTAQEIINLNSVLLSQTMHIDDLNATILALSGELVNKEDALTQNQNKYDILIAKLQEQKAKIKSLTGIKIKVIAELKQNLGKNIQIDPISGSLRLSSNILFDKGSAELKESSKHELKKVFINYVGALTSNKNI
ncbi:MAG: hypothetical protein PHW94_05020, partial [Sulfurimonas sp.]|nr:hypothetical protein [Sulfurimonas sp.]